MLHFHFVNNGTYNFKNKIPLIVMKRKVQFKRTSRNLLIKHNTYCSVFILHGWNSTTYQAARKNNKLIPDQFSWLLMKRNECD